MLNKILQLFKKQAPPPLVSNIETAIPDGGDLLCEADLVITEQISANIYCGGIVTLGPDAIANGNILAMACIIEGTVNGNVTLIRKAELKNTAKIKGNLQACVLNIEEGAVINGRIKVEEEVAIIQVELINKMKRAAEQALLVSKAKAAQANPRTTPFDNDKIGDQLKPGYNNLRAPEKREATIKTEETPKAKPQKELTAAEPQPKATGNTEENNRWW